MKIMKTGRKRIAGAAMITAGVLLIAAAVILRLYNTGESRRSEKEIANILPAVRQAIEERRDNADTYDNIDLYDDISAVEVNGNEYIGILSIPSLELEMPVFGDWNEEKLKQAPCRYYGEANKDNLVIAGHNYSSGFGQLENLSRGESVYFTDMNGKVYNYTVGDIEILDSGDVLPMINSSWQLSLYTCTYSGKQRITVRCGKNPGI